MDPQRKSNTKTHTIGFLAPRLQALARSGSIGARISVFAPTSRAGWATRVPANFRGLPAASRKKRSAPASFGAIWFCSAGAATEAVPTNSGVVGTVGARCFRPRPRLPVYSSLSESWYRRLFGRRNPGSRPTHSNDFAYVWGGTGKIFFCMSLRGRVAAGIWRPEEVVPLETGAA